MLINKMSLNQQDNIRFRINFIIIVGITGLLVVFAVYDHLSTRSRMMTELSDLAELAVGRMSKSLAKPMWNLDEDQIVESVKSEMMEKRIYAVLIINKDGKTIFKGFRRDAGWQPAPVETAIAGDYLQAARGIFKNDENIGRVEVYFTLKFMWETLRHNALGIAAVTILLNLFLFVALYLLMENEKLLRVREQKFRALFERTNDAVFIFSLDNICLDANQQAAVMLGYETDELIGMPVQNVVAPLNYLATMQKRTALLAGQTLPIYESAFRKKEGSEFPVEINVALFKDARGNPLHVQSVVRDITERKQAEETQHKEKEKFQTLTENAPFGLAMISEDGAFTYVNKKFIEMFGYGLSEISNKRDWFYKAYPDPGYRHEIISKWIGDLERLGPGEQRPRIFTVTCKNESRKIIQFRPVQLDTGEHLMTCEDITERKQAEKALKKARNYISNIIDSMPSLLIGVDPDGTITQWNLEARLVTGISSEDAIGQSLEKAIPRLSTETERIRKAIQTREVQTDPKRSRLENGETRYENVTIFPLIANGVEGVVIRVDDMTEQVRLQEMMMQSEKMLSVGGLAAGMAHEINNPLAGMMQTADNMSNRLTDVKLPSNLRAAQAAGIRMEAIRAFMESRGILRMLATINESGRRVAKIVDNMLSFARKSDACVSSNDIAALIEKTLQLAATDYDLKKHYDFKQIEIKKEYENNLPLVPFEGGKIQQVLLNILRNGAQAMYNNDEGKMMNAEEKRACFILRLAYEKAAGMVRIEIEDNGSGMDEANRKRVFEPFFTTKPVGEGTGLGLSVSYFIITENCGGEMSVESAPGKGTKFIIRLPAEQKECKV